MIRFIIILLAFVLTQNIQAQSKENSVNKIQVVNKNHIIDTNYYALESTLESSVSSVISANSEKFLQEKALHQLKQLALEKNYALLQNVTYKVEKENYGKNRKVKVTAIAKAYKLKV